MTRRGRIPPFEATAEDRELVARLVSTGTPFDVIARYVKNPDTNEHIGLATLKRHFKRELADGKEIANAGLIKRAFEMAQTTPAVLIFLLKTRLGWKEPAQDVMLHKTWGELVQESAAEKLPRPALAIIEGGKGKAST